VVPVALGEQQDRGGQTAPLLADVLDHVLPEEAALDVVGDHLDPAVKRTGHLHVVTDHRLIDVPVRRLALFTGA